MKSTFLGVPAGVTEFISLRRPTVGIHRFLSAAESQKCILLAVVKDTSMLIGEVKAFKQVIYSIQARKHSLVTGRNPEEDTIFKVFPRKRCFSSSLGPNSKLEFHELRKNLKPEIKTV